MPRHFLAVLAAAALLASGLAAAAPGDRDPTFGENGIAIVAFGSKPELAIDTIRLPDGGFLMKAQIDNALRLIKLRADGTVDESFGSFGAINPGFAPDYDRHAMLVDAAGRIVVRSGGIPGRIRRYLADGSLDTSFGNPVMSPGSGEFVFPANGYVAIGLDRFGRLWSAVNFQAGSQYYTDLRRHLDSGAPDPAFSGDGVSRIQIDAFGYTALDQLLFDSQERIVISGWFTVARATAAGDLDLSFNGSGRRFGFTNVSDTWVDSSDRIVGAGGYSDGYYEYLRVSRLLPDGSYDASFNGGSVIYHGPPPMQSFQGLPRMALDSSGRIVACALGLLSSGLDSMWTVLRLLPADGSLDASFGVGGYRHVQFSPGRDDLCSAIIPLPDDSLALFGSLRSFDGGNARSDLASARVTSDGNVDTSYGVGTGGVRVDFASSGATVDAAALLPSGSLVVSGSAGVGTFTRAVVARLLPGGTLDSAFGAQGRVTLAVDPTHDAFAAGLAIDASSRICIGVTNFRPAAECTDCHATVVRLMANGALDTSFGNSGVYASLESIPTRTLAIAADPRGYTYVAEEQLDDDRIRMERLTAAGMRDATFATVGVLHLPLAAATLAPNRASAVAVDSLNRTVIAGFDAGADQARTVFLWRLQPDGTIDGSFGNAGLALALPPSGSRIVKITGIAIDASNRIYVTGPAGGDLVAMRFTAAGALDGTFGSGGVARLDPTAEYEESYSVALDGAGVVLGGSARSDGEYVFAAARFLLTGAPDTSFGSGGLQAIDMTPGHDLGHALVIGAGDNKVIVAGDTYRTFGIARLLGAVPPAITRYDFSSDGNPDVILRHAENGITQLWRMNGIAYQSFANIASVDPVWALVGHGDFNGDGKNDLVWRQSESGATYVWYLNDGVLMYDAFVFTIDPVWKIEAVADFNKDGHPDFLFRHASSGVGFVWYFVDTTPMSDQFLYSIDNSWIVENTGDFNNDGYPDFFFRNASSGLGFVWYWDGSSLGASNFLFSIDPAWQVVQIVDWNHDGNVDLLFRNADTGVTFVWYTNGTSLQGSDYLFQIDPVWEIVPYR